MSKKLVTLTAINLFLISFVIFMFYKSEPDYIDNSYSKPKKWDYVNVKIGDYDGWSSGVVVQSDSSSFTFNAGFDMLRAKGGLITVGYTGNYYKLIGTGTFYHKVNSYIGFNIMLITTIIIIGFFVTFFRMQFLILWDEFL